jgi:hypothetical protein
VADDNPYRDRARAVKAYKLARVATLMLREQPELPIEALEGASVGQRARIAELAGVHEPSDATWTVTIGLVREMLAERPI